MHSHDTLPSVGTQSQNRLNRRRLLWYAGGATGMVVSGSLMGCTSSNGTQKPNAAPVTTTTAATQPSAARAVTQTPAAGAAAATAAVVRSASPTAAAQGKRGGVLTQRINSDLPTLDPHQNTSTAVTWATAPMFNQLVQYDPAQRDDTPQTIIADLATKWEQPDPTTIVFTLKSGVNFHDGSPFSSSDVKANIDWLLTPPAGKAAPLGSLIATIDSVTAADNGSVTFKLKRPTASLIASLATHPFAMGQAKDIAANSGIGANPIGTGPFKFKSYTKSNAIELDRNGSYQLQGLPYLDGLKLFVQVDQDSAKANFLAGQLHMYFTSSRPPDDLDDIKTQLGSKAVTVSFPSPSRGMVYTNANQAPFSDVRVRKAISMIIDRKAASDLLSAGVSPIGGYMMPTGVWTLPASEYAALPGYTQPDIAGAKQLLAAAGISNPEWTLTSVNTFQSHVEFVQNELAKAGVKIKLNVQDINTGSAALANGQFVLGYYVSGPQTDDPDQTFGTYAASNGSRNWSRVSEPQIDALNDQQSQQTDFNARKSLTNQMERLALALYQNSTLYFHAVGFARWSTVKNYTEHVSSYSNYRMEQVWLEG